MGPDKNPDNPAAAEMFQKLSAIFEILINKETKSEYDRILKAKQAAVARNNELDAKRRKLKEDLERREKMATEQKDKIEEVKIMKNLDNLLRDLRASGSDLLRKEQELLKQELYTSVSENLVSKLRIKWSKDGDPNYDCEHLNQLLSKYGSINALVVSTKKKGTAIVEFSTNSAAIKAYSFEKGVLSNRLYFEWIGIPPSGFSNSSNGGKAEQKLYSTTFGHQPVTVNSSQHPLNKHEVPACPRFEAENNFDLEEKEEEVFAALRKAAQKQKESENSSAQETDVANS